MCVGCVIFIAAVAECIRYFPSLFAGAVALCLGLCLCIELREVTSEILSVDRFQIKYKIFLFTPICNL